MSSITERPITLYIAATLIAVVLSTRFGIELGFQPENISAFWPPNAILLAGILLLGPSYRVHCILLACPAYILGELWGDVSLSYAAVFSVANCLEVTTALLVISRFRKTQFDFTEFRQLPIIALAVVAGSLVSALIGPGFILLMGGSFLDSFIRWFLGDLFGYIIVTPLVLTIPAWRHWLEHAPLSNKVEAAALGALLFLLSHAAFGRYAPSISELEGAHFLTIPMMLWVAVRLGPKGAAVSCFGVSIIACWFAVHGHGPFSVLTAAKNVESLQLFIISLVLANLTVATLVHERSNILDVLARSRDRLEERVREATRELRERERMHRSLIEGSVQGIFIHCRWNLLYANKSIARTLGYSSIDEFMSIPGVETIIAPHERDRLRAIRDARERGEDVPTEQEAQFLKKDGTLVWLQSVNQLVEWEGKKAIQTAVLDITERKSLQDKLLRSQRLEAVGQLTGGVAHDFNNLLHVMSSNAEMLQDIVVENDKARRRTEAILMAVDRASSLTERLLAFSRQQVLSPVSSDVAELIDGLTDMLRRALGETTDLRVENTADLWPALIDPHQFENALVNLAINARDAMPKGGSLVIKTENVSLDESFMAEHEDGRPGSYVRVAVTDSGMGMTPAVMEKAFEPFFTTKNVGGGSGLGLSMVYGFVKQSEGQVAIDSELGRGTTVSLYLPRSTGDVKRSVDGERKLPMRGSERILIIEDDAEVRSLSTSILRDYGYEVIEANDGREAIDYLSGGFRFHLLFTDVVLPGGMSGIEVAAEAMRLQPNIRLLYTTGYAENPVALGDPLEEGANLLKKPYRRIPLLAKVRAILDGGAAGQEPELEAPHLSPVAER